VFIQLIAKDPLLFVLQFDGFDVWIKSKNSAFLLLFAIKYLCTKGFGNAL
jgi:hypothetical protein